VTAAIETEDRLATQIAVMELVYRELSGRHYSGPVSLPEDVECEPGEVNLLLMLSSGYMCPTDWEVIRALDFNLTLGPYHDWLIALYRALLEIDERRAEALLHVWPTHEVQLPLVPPAAYERWEKVAREIVFFEDAGVTTNRDDVELIADHAAQAGAEMILLDNH
jgi:hypothetical protein